MKDSGIQLRSVNALLIGSDGEPARYWIPAYQRGYRWAPLQVRQLLDDIWEFIQNSEGGPRDAFYCLQPLVVKQLQDGRIEVVDGQQRLTTLYIILTYLKSLVEVLEKKRFQITFETRGEANEPFLSNIDLDRAEENVDFFHIAQAFQAIEQWFKGREGSHKLKFLQHLLNDDEAGRNVKVIWYELSPSEDAVAAFTRLNVGKIPLTNDELIRAIILRQAAEEDPTGSTSLRIAHEWDQLEKALQRDAFWYFISNDPAPSHNRIGLIFRLAVADDITEQLSHDSYGVFHAFSHRLLRASAHQEWQNVKQIFMALEEWHEDRTLFHVVGFLVFNGIDIQHILEKARLLPKNQFLIALKEDAYRIVTGKDLNQTSRSEIESTIFDKLEDFSYKSHGKQIRTTLLLFNLATLLDSPKSNIRFQFDSFKQESWDIEHVRSIESGKPDRANLRRQWLSLSADYLATREDGSNLYQSIKNFLDLGNRDIDDDTLFDPLYEEVLKYFNESDQDVENGLGNLTLLDSHTNRSYKNAVFAVKRQRLLELDKNGIFVPLCTRNVFLKCYNPDADNILFWNRKDADAYIQTIVSTLSGFFDTNQETGA